MNSSSAVGRLFWALFDLGENKKRVPRGGGRGGGGGGVVHQSMPHSPTSMTGIRKENTDKKRNVSFDQRFGIFESSLVMVLGRRGGCLEWPDCGSDVMRIYDLKKAHPPLASSHQGPTISRGYWGAREY